MANRQKDAKFLRNATQTKYRSKKTVVNGITFASKKEATRYSQLLLFVKTGEISDLRLQVPFKLEVKGTLVCKYVADFCYLKNGVYTVEDVKGYITDVYRLKRKLMLAIWNIKILET